VSLLETLKGNIVQDVNEIPILLKHIRRVEGSEKANEVSFGKTSASKKTCAHPCLLQHYSQ
jgi:hypothetical protein